MVLRRIVNVLRCIQPKTIKMKFVDPIRCVSQKKLANGFAFSPVKIDSGAPVRLFFLAEVVFGELGQVISIRSEMVIHHVENGTDALSMRRIDEGSEIVGRSVVARRCEQIDSVVSPAERPLVFCDGHYLQKRNSQIRKFRKLLNGRTPCSFRRERAYVQFVNDLVVKLDAAPGVIGPRKRGWVCDLRRSMRALRLKSRGRIWKRAFAIDEKCIGV